MEDARRVDRELFVGIGLEVGYGDKQNLKMERVTLLERYGLDGPGIESWWDKICSTRPDRFWGPPSLQCNEYRVFPRGKAARKWR